MKKITIIIDQEIERKIEYLSKSWNTNKSETIRTCIDQVFIDKCYNEYGILSVPKKGGEKKRNVQRQELEPKRSRDT